MEGKLVRLRAYEKSDLDSIMKWINDEEVTDFLAGGMLTYPVSSIAEERFIEAAAKSSDTDKSFVIETLTERKYLGGTAFHAINWLNRSAGLGITIGDKSFWGRGYGTDAMITHVLAEPLAGGLDISECRSGLRRAHSQA